MEKNVLHLLKIPETISSGRNFWLYNWWSGYMTPIFIFTKAFFKKSTVCRLKMMCFKWLYCFFFFWLLSKNFLFHGIKSSGNLCQTVVDNIIRRINLCWWKMRYLGIQCIYVFLVCDVSQRTVWSDSWVSEEKRISLSGVLSKDWT